MASELAAGQVKRSLCGAGTVLGERGTLGSGSPVLTAFSVGRSSAWVILNLVLPCLQSRLPGMVFYVAVILSFPGEEAESDNKQLSLGHRARGGRAEPGNFQGSLNSQHSFLMLWGRELGLIPSTAGGPLVMSPPSGVVTGGNKLDIGPLLACELSALPPGKLFFFPDDSDNLWTRLSSPVCVWEGWRWRADL